MGKIKPLLYVFTFSDLMGNLEKVIVKSKFKIKINLYLLKYHIKLLEYLLNLKSVGLSKCNVKSKGS